MEENNSILVVIGGGAAGFFCAVNAARMNPLLQVHLMEKSDKLLSKVKVSGGGRCNVTHACFDRKEFSQFYPRGEHFVKKAFHQFFSTDTIEWFEQRGVQLKKEPDGRMFPVTDSSQTIIDCLLKEATRYGVKIHLRTEVIAIQREGHRWNLLLRNGGRFSADYVCAAAGGFPKLQQFEWLKDTGHTVVPPAPSLFTFNIPQHPITELMGISVPNARIKIQQSKLVSTGPLLITHWGLSGPCVLRLSAWGARELQQKEYRFSIVVCWTGDRKEEEIRNQLQQYRQLHNSRKVSNSNPLELPMRLWNFLCHQAAISTEWRWADVPLKNLNRLVQVLCAYELQVIGKTTFKEEFVTAGGIDTKEVDVHTMQSKRCPGLFFAGELLDVDGITGGFNFQHAWTSGFIAANAIAAVSQD